jgi:ABC-type nitrate/sulfonate/bicarbonate transport system ATPase subunit
MPAIEIRRLAFAYQEHDQACPVLNNINLHIDDGEFICIIGKSGCGKTSLLRLLAGLQPLNSGEIRIDGVLVESPGTDRSIVFQNYTLFPWMTALGNVQFALKAARKNLGRGQVKELAEEFLSKVDMLEAACKYPYQLSGGMRQRVAIARALAMDTSILLLDEPFGALDAKIRRELQNLLVDLWSNAQGTPKTVVFVTHDIHEAIQLADRILFMRPGVIAADLAVELPRPRHKLDLAEKQRMKQLRDQLIELFYQSGVSEVRHEADG